MKNKSIRAQLLHLVQTQMWVRFFVFIFLRPKRFVNEFIYGSIDYFKFKKSVASYRTFLRPLLSSRALSGDTRGLLIVAGHGMNACWCECWAVLSARYRTEGYRVYVLTSRNQRIRNWYFTLFGAKSIYLEDLNLKTVPVAESFEAEIAKLTSFSDFKSYEYSKAPLGQMAMSTFGRLRATGIIDVTSSENREEIRDWIRFLYQTMKVAENLYRQNNIQMLFFTEVFMEEYGAFYYSALSKGLNIIRFAGTVRDEAIIAQHLTLD